MECGPEVTSARRAGNKFPSLGEQEAHGHLGHPSHPAGRWWVKRAWWSSPGMSEWKVAVPFCLCP